MKNYLLFAASLLTLVSCSSDDILGSGQGTDTVNENSAINFDSYAGKITRATSNTGSYAEMLDHQFKVYGVKASTNDTYTTAFDDYLLWDATEKTTSNSNGWEYVGKSGTTHGGTQDDASSQVILQHDQTLKYWDYSSKDYHFVAGSPYKAFTFNLDKTTKDVTSATITGLKGHIDVNKVTGEWNAANEPAPIYVAEPVTVVKENFQNVVKFTFVRQQSKVRVGVYETIPGYKITSIKFYKLGDNNQTLAVDNDHVGNIILTAKQDGSPEGKYFVGSNDNQTGTITYNWTGEGAPSYTFDYPDPKSANNWYGGNLGLSEANPMATKTTDTNLYGTDGDMETNGYFTVIPTPSKTKEAPILIKCDYTLTSEDGRGETINVTGATAAIPAAFCKWNTNTHYTYLFKISQNTNGTTGGSGDKPGLYPITFDAYVENAQDAQGTTTTVTTPSITTYQDGSVTDKSVEYNAKEPIYATVAESTSGVEKELNSEANTEGCIKVYKLSQERTEADLQVENIFKTEITNGTIASEATIGTEAITVNQVKLEANKYISFKPEAGNYYAIQYTTKTKDDKIVYTYKIVYVAAAANAGN